jgi:threonine aldolase
MDGVAIDLESVVTNIVIFRLTGRLTAPDLVARLKARGILASALSPDTVRLVTHYDVDRAACVTTAEALTEETEAAKL